MLCNLKDNKAHLQKVLNAYIDFYNVARPHQGLEKCCSIPSSIPNHSGSVKRKQIPASSTIIVVASDDCIQAIGNVF